MSARLPVVRYADLTRAQRRLVDALLRAEASKVERGREQRKVATRKFAESLELGAKE